MYSLLVLLSLHRLLELVSNFIIVYIEAIDFDY